MCEKNSIIDDDFVDFRNNLSNFVSKIFNIFNNMENLRAEFLYHDKGQVGEIYNKKLFLSIYFPKKNFDSVKQWFDKNNFKNYILSTTNDIGESSLKIPVTSVIDKIIEDEIRIMRIDCEEKAQPFFDGKENELISAYEDECLENDPYYLGVKFISYNGEYPNYCNGIVTLEIEGIEYSFNLSELLGTKSYYIKGINPDAFPENIRRYYHEIIRVMKDNLQYTCCGGCH